MALPYLIFFFLSAIFVCFYLTVKNKTILRRFKACFRLIEKKFFNEFISIKSNKEKNLNLDLTVIE